MKTFYTMLKTELKLSLRGMDMFIFAICVPIVALVILGMIYGNKPAFEGASYTFMQQSFGALTSIAICAGGVMGLPLVVSDYRGKRVLKRLRVTPVRPVIILLVQVTIYALYSLVSLLSLFAVGMTFFCIRLQGSLGWFLLGWLLVMVSMFAIGMMVGGIARNSKIAGIIASILYFPMLIFSGATIPYEIMPVAMQKVANIMPLTQGIKILKSATLGLPIENIWLSILLLVAIIAVCSFVAVKWFRWE